MESSSHYDYLFKVVVIGDIECGKTSIMNRFIEGTFDEESATISVDYKEKIIEVNEKSIKLQVWDTAGLERFKAINNVNGFSYVIMERMGNVRMKSTRQ